MISLDQRKSTTEVDKMGGGGYRERDYTREREGEESWGEEVLLKLRFYQGRTRKLTKFPSPFESGASIPEGVLTADTVMGNSQISHFLGIESFLPIPTNSLFNPLSSGSQLPFLPQLLLQRMSFTSTTLRGRKK